MNNPPPPQAETQAFIEARREAFIATDLDNDGKEDLVTLCGDRSAEAAHGTKESQPELDACAFAGNSGKPLWRVGPLGTAAEAHIHLERVGDKIAAVDSAGVVHVLDAATGRELSVTRLPRAADIACAAPETGGKLWVEGTGFSGLLDLGKDMRSVEPSSTKPACRCDGAGGDLRATSDCDELVGTPADPGSVARFASVAGGSARVSTGAAIGSRPTLAASTSSGSSEPRRWSRAFGSPVTASTVSHTWVARSASLVVTGQELDGQFKVAAYDALSGEPRWEVAAGSLNDIVASDRAVYVLRQSRVDVLDPGTGATVAGLGSVEHAERAPELAARQVLRLVAPAPAIEPENALPTDMFERLRLLETLARKEIQGARLTSVAAVGVNVLVATFQEPQAGLKGGALRRVYTGACASTCSGHLSAPLPPAQEFPTPPCKFADVWGEVVKIGVPKDAKFRLLLGVAPSATSWKFQISDSGLTPSLDATGCKVIH